MKKKTKMQSALRVKWKDHFSFQGRTDKTDSTPVIVTSFGVPIKEDKEMLVLAQNCTYDSGNAGAGNTMAIIKKCIVSRKKIK